MDFAWGLCFIWGGSVTNMGYRYSCERNISENKKSFVFLEHIRSLISLTWESRLKVRILLSNKLRNYLWFLAKCTSVSVKYAYPKNQFKKNVKCVSFKTFMWLHDHYIKELWYYIHLPKKFRFWPLPTSTRSPVTVSYKL